MKKIFFIIILILAGTVLVSFLIDSNKNDNNTIVIYIDRDVDKKELVKKDIYNAFIKEKIYKNIIFSNFDAQNIDSYIVSNGKNSIFVTSTKYKSNLFSIKSLEYLNTIVAASSFKNTETNIDYNTLLSNYTRSDKLNVKKINEIFDDNSRIVVLPYNYLNLHMKPLKVDGIFPSVYNVKKGIYPGSVRVFLSTVNHKIYRQCKKFITVNAFNKSINRLFSIIAGGDIMLGRAVGKYMDRYGIYYPFEKIRQLIEKNDIAFANLECPLTDGGIKFYPNKGIYFRANPATALSLKWCGFDVLSIANNHIFDWGVTGALDTENYLKKAGIKYSGIGETIREASKPATFNIGDIKICFFSMDDIYPIEVKNGKKSLKIYNYSNEVKKIINRLNKNYDVVIVSYHTGIEYKKHPEDQKIKRMRKLIDYGANVVFGSHPHVIQDVEIYKNGIIAYSLGNLIFDQNWSEDTSKGLLLEIGFIGKKPIYCRPITVNIIRGQAVLENSLNVRELKLVLNQ
ncbi:MAG: hypothetical protein DRP84_08075 [Spirochaetes bacterium]|nr:MAG: hypothetical protein DRP84_08075 [Spirochaetota bacterium]